MVNFSSLIKLHEINKLKFVSIITLNQNVSQYLTAYYPLNQIIHTYILCISTKALKPRRIPSL